MFYFAKYQRKGYGYSQSSVTLETTIFSFFIRNHGFTNILRNTFQKITIDNYWLHYMLPYSAFAIYILLMILDMASCIHSSGSYVAGTSIYFQAIPSFSIELMAVMTPLDSQAVDVMIHPGLFVLFGILNLQQKAGKNKELTHSNSSSLPIPLISMSGRVDTPASRRPST